MAEQKTLRVAAVTGKNVLGIEEFSLTPGPVTFVRGKNAQGKTSILTLVQAALSGGNLAKLTRVNKDTGEAIGEPEAVLVIEGDSERYRVEKRGSKPARVRQQVGTSAAYEDVLQPQTWLNAIFDAKGANPVSILTASDNERALMILQALPLTFDLDSLTSAIELPADSRVDLEAVTGGPASKLHTLERIALLRQAIFDERTGVNRDVTQKKASAEQLKRATPAEMAPGYEEEILSLDRMISEESQTAAAARQSVRRERDAEEARLNEQHRAFAQKTRGAFERQAAEMRAEVERRISEMKDTTERAIADDRDALTKSLAAIAERFVGATDKIATDEREIEAMRGRLSVLREQAKAAEKAQTLREQTAQFEADAEALGKLSAALTTSLANLDLYRRTLAENMPIKGLSIEGKEVKIDGLPWSQTNQARRVEIAVQVALLRAGRLALIVVDGAEALDSEQRALLIDEIKRCGAQAFLSVVTDESLTIETE